MIFGCAAQQELKKVEITSSSVLVRVAGVSKVCPNGGVLLDYGLDSDGDGLLSDSKVSETFEVYHGADGADGMWARAMPIDIVAVTTAAESVSVGYTVAYGVEVSTP